MQLSRMKQMSLGFQHVLAMYAGAVVVPLLVGSALGLTAAQLTYLIAIDIMMCGVATILQVWKKKFSGIGLPVVLGCTFTAVGPMIAIGNTYGIPAIYGAIITAGLFVILIGSFFSRLVKLFPPVVTGAVVLIIGITLVPVAMNDIAGGQGSADYGSMTNLALGFGTLAVILILFRFGKGFLKSIAILSGIIIGTAAASFMGMVDFSAVGDASWLHLPQVFYFGTPEFHLVPILTMMLVVTVGLIEATGVYFALGDITEKKVEADDLKRGYRAEGIAIILGGLVNAFPYTTYSQNVGLVQLSGVKSNQIIYIAGGMLILLGLVPKIGAITIAIPTPVLGGAMLAMFGMVIAYGIKMLSRVDFSDQRNLMIVAVSVGMGLGVTVVPEMFAIVPENLKVITESGIVMGSTTAIVLNFIYHIGDMGYLKSKSHEETSLPGKQVTE